MDKTARACSIGVNTENTELASSLANLALMTSDLTKEQIESLKLFVNLAYLTVFPQNQSGSASLNINNSSNNHNNNNINNSSSNHHNINQSQCLNLSTKSKRSRQQSLQTNTSSSPNGSPDTEYLESHESHETHQDDLTPEPNHHNHHLHHTQSYQESFDDTDDYDDTHQDHDQLNDQDDYDDDVDDDKEFAGMSLHNHSSNHHYDHDEVEKSKQIIQEFAQELKQRRKYIRLSQKGAAQSLRAFTNGQQPCTDAIIYHFENLQMEPERALQLIPMLKDWLRWAEKQRRSGKTLDLMPAVTKVPRERKRKVVLFNEKAKQYLEDSFAKNNHPDRWQLDVISEELNIPTRSIRKWFTNRRQRKRFADKFSPMVGSTGETSDQMT